MLEENNMAFIKRIKKSKGIIIISKNLRVMKKTKEKRKEGDKWEG